MGAKDGQVKKRWFIIDDDNLTQFLKRDDKKPCNSRPFLNASSKIESKAKAIKWTDAAAHRLMIVLRRAGNQRKTVFVYSNDMNFLKALLVRVTIAA